MPITDFQELVKAHVPADKQAALLQEVEQTFDKAGAAAKIQEANADLVRKRDELEKDAKRVKELEGTLTAAKTEKEQLEARLKSAQEGKVDLAEVNALREELKTVKDSIAKSETEKLQALKEKAESDLRNAVLGAAVKAKNPGQVFTLMKAEGRVGFKEDGKTPFFVKLNAEGQPVALKVEDAVEAFLAENEHLRAASGTKGSGTKPNQTPSGAAFNARDHL
jgi:predicted RNase H-like nuclease (RuvC/YqgF family)